MWLGALLSVGLALAVRLRTTRTARPDPILPFPIEWLVQVDDSPRFRSPCLAIQIDALTILANRHCVATRRAYVAAPLSTGVRSAEVTSIGEEEHDLVLLRTAHRETRSYAPLPSVLDTTSSFRRGYPRYWILSRDGHLTRADVVDEREELISVVSELALCFGDSGSPLLREHPSGQLDVIGLLSRGDRECRAGGVNRFSKTDVVVAQMAVSNPPHMHAD